MSSGIKKFGFSKHRFDMNTASNSKGKRIHRLVLTGGPCGGKTTAQAMITSVFENMGWKIYRTPEVATILFSGGAKHAEMDKEDFFRFEENLLNLTMEFEQTYYDLAMKQDKDSLIICDRGIMDAVAYIDPADWEEMKKRHGWNDVDLRDKRYDHVVHLVTAADGAEGFYTNANNAARSENAELAKQLDLKCQHAWVGHPYFDVIDNSTPFPEKVNRLVRCVASRMGIDLGDRFATQSVKRKWLVRKVLNEADLPKFEDFEVQHIYLKSQEPDDQLVIRRRSKPGKKLCSYQYMLRRNEDGRQIETRQQVSQGDYRVMVATQRDHDHAIVEMKRRCFMFNNNYFQLETYELPVKCAGLLLLTCYTARDKPVTLPECLLILEEVTDDPKFSLFKLTQAATPEEKVSSDAKATFEPDAP